MFRFNNKIYTQGEGAAMGFNIFMIWWDRKIKIYLVKNFIFMNMFSHYVDDINIEVNSPPQESNLEIEIKTNTTKSIQEIANSIFQSSKITIDYMKHPNHIPSVLDAELRLETMNNKTPYFHHIMPNLWLLNT